MWIVSLIDAGRWIVLISWLIWVPLSITLHELGHGWAALRQGDRTPIEYRRMTLNPVVHMGGTSLLVFALFGIAWGLMPVNPSRFRQGRVGEALVAAAGPAMNFGLVVVCVLAVVLSIRFLPSDVLFVTNLQTFLFYGAYLNTLLFLFNLLPVPPLDGSRIVASASRKARLLFSKPEASLGLFVALFLLFWVTEVGDFFFAQCKQGLYDLCINLSRSAGASIESMRAFGAKL